MGSQRTPVNAAGGGSLEAPGAVLKPQVSPRVACTVGLGEVSEPACLTSS